MPPSDFPSDLIQRITGTLPATQSVNRETPKVSESKLCGRPRKSAGMGQARIGTPTVPAEEQLCVIPKSLGFSDSLGPIRVLLLGWTSGFPNPKLPNPDLSGLAHSRHIQVLARAHEYRGVRFYRQSVAKRTVSLVGSWRLLKSILRLSG